MRIHNIKKNLYHSPMYLPNRFDNDQDNQLIFAVTEDYQGGEAKLSIDTALCGIKHPALPSGSTSLSISSPSMAIKNIASPIRRRNNYTSSNNGPVFSATKQEAPVFTAQKSSQVKFSIQARIDKGFFLAEGNWACYRRNYFQVSGCFNLSFAGLTQNAMMDPQLYVEVAGNMHAITGYRLGVACRVTSSDKVIELVQHTSKRDKGPQLIPGPKAIKSGGSLSNSSHPFQQYLMNSSSEALTDNIVTFERLQFKTATANNGKRRAAQQYYTIQMDLYAEYCDFTGEISQTKVATVYSAPLIVRGRSPGHYFDGENSILSPYSALPHSFMDRSSCLAAAQNGFVYDLSGPFRSKYTLNNTTISSPLASKREDNFPLQPPSPSIHFKPSICDKFLEEFGDPLVSPQDLDEKSPMSSMSYLPSATNSENSPLFHGCDPMFSPDSLSGSSNSFIYE